jgi:molybdopterin-containing oxidoreductase family iron-sulfur binding subunit
MPELDRRDFLRVVGLSAGAAAAAACQEPVEKIIPYLNHPEEVIPGTSTYYASTCRECPVACATLIATREGRPIKVDGNPEDPVGRGKLCVRGQASLHRTFDPARLAGPQVRDPGTGKLTSTTWEAALDTLVGWLGPAAQKGMVHFLTGHETGVLDGLIDRFLQAIGSPHRVRFEPFGHEALRTANRAVFGTDAIPHFALDRADVLLSFGADFIETWLNPVQNQVLYASARRGGKSFSVYVGPRLGASGQAMDLWLRTKPGTEIRVALALAGHAARVRGGAAVPAGAQVSLESAAQESGVPLEQLRRVADRLASAQAPLALPPGNELQGTNAAAFVTAVQLLNVSIGAPGRTLLFGPDHNVGRLARFRDLKELAGKIRGGEVQVLLVHGSNPLYSAPQVGLADALGQQDLRVVSFASHADETTAAAHLVLPDHTPFEAWGDAEPVPGVRRLQQPTVRPLFDTRATGDVLIEAARRLGAGDGMPSSLLAALQAAYADWPAAVQRGGVLDGAASGGPPASGGTALAGMRFDTAEISGEGTLDLLVYPSLHFYDGRSARSPVLQEIPNPVTKMTWGSYAELHPETARELGIREFDVVRVSTDVGSVELPAFLNEALHPSAVAIEAGQGQVPVEPEHTGQHDRLRRREKIGVNALAILPGRLDPASGALAWLSSRCKVEKTGERRYSAKTQATFDQEGREIAQVVALGGVGHAAAHVPAHGMQDEHGGDSHGDAAPYAGASHLEKRPFDPAQDARDPSYRWGLTIDLDACVGCNACMTACVQENNIPAIGDELVKRGREMHWIRIERYVEHHGEELEIRNLPMLCQHCGAAPCETVCPVYATYHNDEGLNVMVPNRCIGTRYCGNNCPYKVRRFNYFPYDFDVRYPENLRLNPDVMVRSKGVMEKCTLCVQRINGAKDRALREGRTVREGELSTACAQACPSDAIHFGNYKDPESAVAKAREDPRAYAVLHHLNTRPGVTYLRKVLRVEHEKA